MGNQELMKIYKHCLGFLIAACFSLAVGAEFVETFESEGLINQSQTNLDIVQGKLVYAQGFQVVSDFTNEANSHQLDNSTVSNQVVDMQVLDANNDDSSDILFIYKTGEITLWQNDATGTNTDITTTLSLTGNEEIYASVVLDFNADGFDDYAVARSGSLQLFINQQDASFTLTQTLLSEFRVRKLLSHDVNYDGFSDVLVINDSAPITIHLNQAGVLQGGVALNSEINAAFDAELADVNGDGLDDLVLGNFEQVNKILLGSQFDTESGFLQEREFDLTRSPTQNIVLLDMNGDGFADLWEGNLGNNVLYESSSSGFIAMEIDDQQSGSSLSAADLENDGKVEVLEVVPNLGLQLWQYVSEKAEAVSRTMTVAEGFVDTVTASTLIADALITDARYPDVNNDGYFDIVTASQDGNRIIINSVTVTQEPVLLRSGSAESKNINTNNVNVGAIYLEVDAIIPAAVSAKYFMSVDGGDTFQSIRPKNLITFSELKIAPDVRWKVTLDGGTAEQTPAITSLNINLVERVLSEDDLKNFNKILPKVPGTVVTNEAGSYSLILGFLCLVMLGLSSLKRIAIPLNYIRSRKGMLPITILLSLASAQSYATFENPVQDGFIAEHEISGQHLNIIDLQSGNFNGDDKHDVLVINNAQPNQVYLTNELGLRFAGVVENIGYDYKAADVADINDDGLDDIAIATATGIRIYINATADNAFEVDFDLVQIGTTQNITTLKFSDLDGDGDKDIVFAANNQPISWLENYEGVYDPAIPLISVVYDTQAIAIADMNNDQLLDIVLGNDGVNSILYQDIEFDFQTVELRTDSATPTLTNDVALYQYNNDSKLDIVFANKDSAILLESFSGNTASTQTVVIADTYIQTTLTTSAENLVVEPVEFDGFCGIDVIFLDKNEGAYIQFYSELINGYEQPTNFFQTNDENATFSSIAVDDFDGDGNQDFIVGGSGYLKLYTNLGLMFQIVTVQFPDANDTYIATVYEKQVEDSPFCPRDIFRESGDLGDFFESGGSPLIGDSEDVSEDVFEGAGGSLQPEELGTPTVSIEAPKGVIFEGLFDELSLRKLDTDSSTSDTLVSLEQVSAKLSLAEDGTLAQNTTQCVEQSDLTRCFAKTGDYLQLSAEYAADERANINPFIFNRELTPVVSGEQGQIITAKTQVLATDPDGEVEFGIYSQRTFGEVYNIPTDNVRIVVDNTKPSAPVFVEPRDDEQLRDKVFRLLGYSAEQGVVEVMANGQKICTSAVLNTFEWECELNIEELENKVALDDSIQSITLIAINIDYAGNASEPKSINITSISETADVDKVETVVSSAGGLFSFWSLLLLVVFMILKKMRHAFIANHLLPNEQ